MGRTNRIKRHGLLWYVIIPAFLLDSAVLAGESSASRELDAYNVVFTFPSKDETGSIPLGNGNVGVNLWVEEDGDLLFYVSRHDAWSEIATLLKHGRVRLHLSPNPFRKGLPYRQELKLREGRCEIVAGPAGSETRITFFVDSVSPDVRVRVQSRNPTAAEVMFFNWRADRRDAHTLIGDACYPLRGAPPEVDTYISADHWDNSDASAIVSYHRNEYSPVDTHIKWQGMADFTDVIKKNDFMKDSTFGVKIVGRGIEMTRLAYYHLRSKEPATDFEIVTTTHLAQTPDAGTWLGQLKEHSARAPAFDTALARTEKYWSDYWNRSWIFITGDSVTIPHNPLKLTLGKISDGGGGDFSGTIARATFAGLSMTDGEVKEASGIPPEKALTCNPVLATMSGTQGAIKPGDAVDPLEAGAFSNGITAEAWINATGDGRIWDKSAPGSAQGLVVDMMTTLQEMLLQNGEQNEIMLLQAWPREWNVKFKLHAHANTTVEGELSKGKLMNLKIEPKSRENDVRIPKWAQ